MLTEDIVDIQQLICREREARDRSWWNEMRATWAEDSYVNVSWYSGPGHGFIDGSRRMQSKNGPAKHRLGPIMVRVNGNRAVATVSVTISTRVSIEGVEADLSSDARLLYRTVKEQGVWLLTRLDCIYESDSITAAIPGEVVTIDVEVLKKYRKSYRCLLLILETSDATTNNNLPGDDRPDQVKQLYSEAFFWAGLSVS